MMEVKRFFFCNLESFTKLKNRDFVSMLRKELLFFT